MFKLPMRKMSSQFPKNIKVAWIALTGGPCSGKSSSLCMIQEELTKRGFRVLVIDEAASRIINSGIKANEYGGYALQKSIALTQVANELIYQDLIENSNYDMYVVICDRGLMDGAAYVKHEEYEKLLEETFGTTMAEARDSYDLVIHMVTAADGAEKYYNLKNHARAETPEQARAIDKKTQNAWMGHPNYKIIGNEGTTFKKKKQRVLDLIYSYLGEPMPIDSYKKYLIKMPDISFIKRQKAYTKVDIHRYYLPNSSDSTERSITERGTNGDFTYCYSERRHLTDADRIIVQHQITKKQFDKILDEVEGPVRELRKVRHCFTFNNKYYEVDVFPFWGRKALLKVQPTNVSSSIEIPFFIEMIQDVTNDDTYKNISLASIIHE